MSAARPRDWHQTLRQWAKPPSETEDQRAANATSMIRDAIREFAPLAPLGIDIYPTGSYRNNTNARLESDVDIAVVLRNTFFYELPPELSVSSLGFAASSISFATYRSLVEDALRAKFGAGMTPGDKAFDVHENTRRLDADVAPFFRHRCYTGKRNADGSWQYHEGVEMRSVSEPNKRIINWHAHHYEAGVKKNDATGRRFKRITRILKKLRTEMKDSSDSRARDAASVIPSFLLESLVYNAPNSRFNQQSETYYEDTKSVVAWLWNRINKNEHTDFKEVSEMKWLWRSGQAWTPAQVQTFLVQVWSYVGFAKD